MLEKQKSILKRVLLRNDNDFVSLLESASHVSLYVFENNKWCEADVEGPLYIYNTETLPMNRMIIFNRKSNNVFMMSLDETYNNESDKQFIILSSTNLIYGIWFFNINDYKKVNNLLRKISNLRNMSKELIGSLAKYSKDIK
ncbi:hypothetical protein BDAP_002526 [Binucleata daphniae]